MTNKRLTSSLLVLAFIVASCSATVKNTKALLFTKNIAEDATPKVLAAVMNAWDHPVSEIKFEKGTYHFYPDKGLEKFVHISNHNDVCIKTAFPLKKFKNLTIDGQGSTFIFHGRMIPFLITDCENIKVQNLSVDWSEPFHSEGRIVAKDEKNKTFDVQISDEYPYEIRNGQMFFIKEYYEHSLGQSILFDPKYKAIAYGTELCTPLTIYSHNTTKFNLDKIKYKYKRDPRGPEQAKIGVAPKLFTEELKPGLVRIHNHTKKLPEPGLIITFKGVQSENRLAPAFRLSNVYGFDAKNVTVHHAGGMGLIAENSADLTLDAFNVTPSHGRMVSTTADATHFVGCRGKVILKNCTFNNQLDDATNVHGTYQEVVDVLDENTLGIRMGHFQQQGFVVGKENDTIGFVRLSDSFFPYDKVTIKSITKINSRYQIIKFNEKLPSKIKAGDLIENLDAYPELLVQNCNISRNRARGLLLSTPKKIVIDNNYFHTEMEALLIPVESGHWYESGSVRNLTITNNTFEDCNLSGFDRGIIRFETDDDNENIAFKNIRIENNTIKHYDSFVMEISNTDGLLFKGNSISASNTFPQLYPNNPAIRIKSSRNIVFKNNTYDGKAKLILETDKALAGLKFQ